VNHTSENWDSIGGVDMQLYPAIDLKDGKCVRLQQGKFDNVTVFNDDPANAALAWRAAGATYIHVVDLDGSRVGAAHNNDAIALIVSASGLPVQVGGGIRSMRDIEEKLAIGVSRVILGTAAINDPCFVKHAVEAYGAKIAVGIDAVHGKVAISGWEEVSGVSAIDLGMKMKQIGVQTIIYTDISKDGMMQGPNVEATKELVDSTELSIIASGGISVMSDLERVRDIGVSGVIIGTALYKGAIDLHEAVTIFEKA